AQQNAATTPALRGPARSSQPPQIAAEEPSSTKNSVYIQPSSETRQSQHADTMRAKKPMLSGQATDAEMATAFDSGSQNTLKPYAMPMHRWIASAAGGTSHRLNPGLAMMRSLASRPGCGPGAKSSTSVLLIGFPLGCGGR